MGEKIILYSSTECNRCKIVKKMLDVNQVCYEEVNDKQIMINEGFVQVPVIKVNEKIIEDFTSILAWLEDKGYYSERGIYESN